MQKTVLKRAVTLGILTLLAFLALSIFYARRRSQPNLYKKGKLLYADNFSAPQAHWHSEGVPPAIHNGVLEIDTNTGTTVWFKPRLSGNIMIEYDATIIDKGGPNDHVRDLNCFWMATDPNSPDDFFAASPERADGRFKRYHKLNLYYVGYGGNFNTTTRFRRYEGGDRVLLGEYTDPKRLLLAGHKYHIQLVVFDHHIEYWRDGEQLFHLEDLAPYRQGHFGFRTVDNHLIIDNFKVHKLIPPYGERTGPERSEYRDKETGVRVVRLTNSARQDKHGYYDICPFSPDDKWVVFSSAAPGEGICDIYVVNVETGQLRRIAGAGRFSHHTGAFPWWSADGKYVFYNAYVAGKRHLAKVSIDGLDIRFFPGAKRVAVSPDNTRFIMQTPDTLFLYDIPTGIKKKILDIQQIWQLSPHTEEIKNRPTRLVHPKWSPDGSKVLVGHTNGERNRKPYLTAKELYILNPDGGGLYRLCDLRHHASWSPDGTKIIFNGNEPKNQQLYSIDASGGERQRVVDGFFGGIHPTLSPNGRYIVTDVFDTEIYITTFKNCLVLIDVKNGSFKKLVNVPSTFNPDAKFPPGKKGSHYHPSWSHDGRWVVYDSDQSGLCQVYMAEVSD